MEHHDIPLPEVVEMTVPVDTSNLAVTWRTLMAVAHNYEMGSLSEASLIEARRLIEVEVRAQYGDDAWAAMTD